MLRLDLHAILLVITCILFCSTENVVSKFTRLSIGLNSKSVINKPSHLQYVLVIWNPYGSFVKILLMFIINIFNVLSNAYIVICPSIFILHNASHYLSQLTDRMLINFDFITDFIRVVSKKMYSKENSQVRK